MDTDSRASTHAGTVWACGGIYPEARRTQQQCTCREKKVDNVRIKEPEDKGQVTKHLLRTT